MQVHIYSFVYTCTKYPGKDSPKKHHIILVISRENLNIERDFIKYLCVCVFIIYYAIEVECVNLK